MSRFDRIHTPRMQVEVNLPQYDVRKSMADAAKRQQRKRQQAKEQRSKVREDVPDVVPITLGAEKTTTHAQVQECPPFSISL